MSYIPIADMKLSGVGVSGHGNESAHSVVLTSSQEIGRRDENL
jgi:hypothetical protein